jgi:hypothetical protein
MAKPASSQAGYSGKSLIAKLGWKKGLKGDRHRRAR